MQYILPHSKQLGTGSSEISDYRHQSVQVNWEKMFWTVIQLGILCRKLGHLSRAPTFQPEDHWPIFLEFLVFLKAPYHKTKFPQQAPKWSSWEVTRFVSLPCDWLWSFWKGCGIEPMSDDVNGAVHGVVVLEGTSRSPTASAGKKWTVPWISEHRRLLPRFIWEEYRSEIGFHLFE